MNKITVVCHKDHEKGYEDYVGKCLLCEIEKLKAQQAELVAWKDEQGNVRMTLDVGEIQSSVGYVYSVNGEHIKNACIRSDIPNGTPLYTAPPRQPWVGLTDEEVINVMPDDNTPISLGEAFSKFADLIEAKLKEKNT